MHAALITASFVFLVTSSAFAVEADCPAKKTYNAVDLRDSFPPLHDQGDKGWCYADGTADQLTYWGVKHPGSGISLKNGQYPSSVAVALSSNTEDREQELMSLATARDNYTNVENKIESDLDQIDELEHSQVAFLKKDALADPAYSEIEKQLAPLNKSYWDLKDSKDPSDKKSFELINAKMAVLEFKRELILSRIPEYVAIVKGKDKLNEDLEILTKQRSELNLKIKFQEPDGGKPEEVLNSLIDHGVCPENEIQSDPISSDAEQVFSTNLSQYLNEKNDENLCAAALGLANYFKFLNVSQIVDILKNSGDSIMQLLYRCKKITFPGANILAGPSVVPIGSQNDANGKGDLQEVTKVLDQHIPVGISYSADIMNMGVIYDKPPFKRSLHYSLLVGKRYSCEKSEPEYLIRNSWGPHHCEEDQQTYISEDDLHVTPQHFAARARITNAWIDCKDDCLKKTGNNTSQYISCIESCRTQFGPMQMALEQPPFECDQGYIWMPESQLKKGFWNGLYVR